MRFTPWTLFLSSLTAFSLMSSTAPSSYAVGVEAPIYDRSFEDISGQSYGINFYNTFNMTDQIKSLDYSCVASSGSCIVGFSYNYPQERYLVGISVTGYKQGFPLNVKVIRKWISALTNESGFIESSISLKTLLASPRPTRGPVKSEVQGCSFKILNYNHKFNYYFKSQDFTISKEGRVRLFLPPGVPTSQDYISITRTGHTTINAIETLMDCTAKV